ncbi:MAG: hypothetical protein JWO46_1795 [Nocardioidaceae bacterium]|nr:hypothetical protein [Nocardioidaceae bacterium]
MTAFDVFRLVVQIVAGVLLATTALVAIQHIRLWRADRTRLLPLHVGIIAISYDLFIVAVMTLPLQTWRVWIYTPALLLGLFGMLVITRHQDSQRGDRS